LSAYLNSVANVGADDIQFVSVSEMTFSDGTLNAYDVTDIGTDLVEGFIIRLKAGNVTYQFHARETGAVFLGPKYVAMETTVGSISISLSALGKTEFLGVREATWPDKSMGGFNEDAADDTSVTSGYVVDFTLDGRRFEYHIDQADINTAYLNPIFQKSLEEISVARNSILGLSWIESDDIILKNVRDVVWSRDNLGWSDMDAADTLAGYRITFQSNGVDYVVHTNQAESVIDVQIVLDPDFNNNRMSISGSIDDLLTLAGLNVTDVIVAKLEEIDDDIFRLILGDQNNIEYTYTMDEVGAFTIDSKYSVEALMAIQLARDDLMMPVYESLLEGADVEFSYVESVIWNDTFDVWEGLNGDVETPGFVIGFNVNGVVYEYHSGYFLNQDQPIYETVLADNPHFATQLNLLIRNDIDAWILANRALYPDIPTDETRFEYVIINRDTFGLDFTALMSVLDSERIVRQTANIFGEVISTHIIKDTLSEEQVEKAPSQAYEYSKEIHGNATLSIETEIGFAGWDINEDLVVDALDTYQALTYFYRDELTGDLISITDRNGLVTTYGYEKDGESDVTRSWETTHGFMNGMNDADGLYESVFYREHDDLGMITRQIDPNGHETQFMYEADGVGNITHSIETLAAYEISRQ